MRIVGGKVLQDGAFTDADLVIDGGLIEGIEPPSAFAAADEGAHEATLDARGCFVVPGFIDLHFHGCAGHDFCEGTPDALRAIAAWEASRGVTAICPATMTYPEDVLAPIMDAAAAFSPAANEAALVGINMEGPFISPNRVGAQNPAYVQACDVAMVRRLQERAGGLIKLVDVAPEEPGALEFIREMADEVRISLAHTCADYDTARAAFEAGARQLTHTFNAMPRLHHRNPGPIPAAVECTDAVAELICDGVHVHPAMIRLLFSLFGDGRVVLISDSMEATGLTDGSYTLGGQAFQVRGNRATLADGTIAGSATDLAACVRYAVQEAGIPLASAVRAATENPARALGVFDTRGSLTAGKIADVVILDADLNIRTVLVRGCVA